MTVKELFENKYRERMATITEREWKRAKEDAEYKNKLVASNRHRQYHGKVDAFWLTAKGYKEMFA